MASKVCPLCGRTYGLTMTMCPVDGRMLVSDRSDKPDPSIRLSSATEALLGDILEGDGESEGRHRHDQGDNAATVIGPPPEMSDDMDIPSDDMTIERERPRNLVPGGVTETTVSTAFSPVKEVTLSRPLAELAQKPAATLDSVDMAVTHEKLPRARRLSAAERRAAATEPSSPSSSSNRDAGGSPPPSSGSGERRKVFDDLDMEVGQLDTGAGDDEVTRKVDRRAPEARPLQEAREVALDTAASLSAIDDDSPSAARSDGRLSATEAIGLEVGLDAVDGETLMSSEDTFVEAREKGQRAQPPPADRTVAASTLAAEAQRAAGPSKLLWMFVIMVLAALAIFVWTLALS